MPKMGTKETEDSKDNLTYAVFLALKDVIWIRLKLTV